MKVAQLKVTRLPFGFNTYVQLSICKVSGFFEKSAEFIIKIKDGILEFRKPDIFYEGDTKRVIKSPTCNHFYINVFDVDEVMKDGSYPVELDDDDEIAFVNFS